MLYLAQVTFGNNPPSLLGIFYIIFSIAYLIFTTVWLPRNSKLNGSALNFYIQQSIFISILMLVCGWVFTFQSGYLNSNYQFAQFLLFLLINYLIIKDIVMNIL